MKSRESLMDWERALHRDLESLPDLQAPPTLIPRVQQEIESREATPAQAASWWRWPLGWRVASVVLVAGAVGLLGWLSGFLGDLGLGARLLTAALECREAVGDTVRSCERLLGGGLVFWREYGQWILTGTAALLLATYLTAVAAGSALYRLAWRRSL
jgi:hypothetical protein